MNTKGREPRRRIDLERKPARTGRPIVAWILAVASVAILVAGAGAFYYLHWHPGLVLYATYMLLAIPAGLWFGTQDKDYWQ